MKYTAQDYYDNNIRVIPSGNMDCKWQIVLYLGDKDDKGIILSSPNGYDNITQAQTSAVKIANYLYEVLQPVEPPSAFKQMIDWLFWKRSWFRYCCVHMGFVAFFTCFITYRLTHNDILSLVLMSAVYSALMVSSLYDCDNVDDPPKPDIITNRKKSIKDEFKQTR